MTFLAAVVDAAAPTLPLSLGGIRLVQGSRKDPYKVKLGRVDPLGRPLIISCTFPSHTSSLSLRRALLTVRANISLRRNAGRDKITDAFASTASAPDAKWCGSGKDTTGEKNARLPQQKRSGRRIVMSARLP